MNYFELFGLPVGLQVDKSSLAKKYFELQRKYHPDFFTRASEAEQKEALENSSLANKGLKILKDPDEVIAYVLQLKGLLHENEKYELPPAFLMEMMEMNEKLTEQDTEKSTRELVSLEQQLYDEVKQIIENFNEFSTSAKDLQKVKEYYFKKKYLRRILDRLAD